MASRLSGALVFAGAGILLLAALVLSTSHPLVGAVVCAFLAGVIALVVIGPGRAGTIAMVLAFATAPAYRGLEGLTGGVATPTDLLLVAAFILLLPGVIARRLSLPTAYVLGLVLVVLCGLIATAISDSPTGSVFGLVQWLFFLGGLPILIAWWRPGTTTVVTLLWAYVVGQGVSTAYAVVSGPVVGDRYEGLSHHPNAFGMAGMTAIAILMYLVPHHRSTKVRVVLLGAGAVSAASIAMSGSRAAVVVVAVLALLVPLVERSAVSGFVFGWLGALAFIAFPLVVQSGHGGSALSRLSGQGTASAADQARTQGLNEGLRRFWDSPIIGSGLGNVEVIHNVFLEVAVGVGVFGLVGYLMVLFVLTRPLLGNHVHRRLGYLPLAFVGMAPALPGIWDRTMWVPIGLSILAILKQDPPGEVAEDETGDLVRQAEPAPGLGRPASA